MSRPSSDRGMAQSSLRALFAARVAVGGAEPVGENRATVSTERVSPLDASFLQIETDAAHMHVGWTLIFEGEAPPIEALRRHVAARLDAVPRFRRRVVEAPLGLLDPVWADDPRFEIANHVHALALGPPGTPRQLRELTGALLSHRLDRSRPLWHLHLVTGLEDGRFAVVGQAHHTLVDGIAALEVGMLLLDGDARAPAAIPGPWRPEPPPGLAGLAARTLEERARRALVTATAAARAARAPATLLAAAAQARDAASALARTAFPPAPASALAVALTRRRAVGFAELDLHEARAVGARHGATVNDVVLAASGVALAAFLRRRGDRCPSLRAMVPVNVRPRGTERDLGNRISFMFVELPLEPAAPGQLLRAVREQTRAHKDAGAPRDLQNALDAAAWLPAPARRQIARLSARPETFHAVVSNIPGPADPLYLLRRRLLAAYPAVPLAEGHALSVGVLSYHGRLHVGVYADQASVPDVDDVARGIGSAFDALRLDAAARGGHVPPPWRRRARERRRAATAARGG
jgi:diacylglycerol O-acyltransferase / wax synthase